MGNVDSAGVHVIMDGYVYDSSVFTVENINDLFMNLVETLSMKMLGTPVIYEVPVDQSVLDDCLKTGEFKDEGGITGVVVISTSHMSIHCWPLQKFFSLDVFSCKSFDENKAILVIKQQLDVTSHNISVMSRKRPNKPLLLVTK